MNITDTYFDFLIGSVTLDIYQPKMSGIINIVDTTQGYYRKTVHLATRYPRKLDSQTKNILLLFPPKVWMATLMSLYGLSAIIMVAYAIYLNISPALIKANVDPIQVFLRLFAGIAECDNENWFPIFSTGMYVVR